MTWTFVNSNGMLLKDGSLAATCYSGFGPGLNDPSYEMVANVGPIPSGSYIIGPFFDDPEKGPVVAHLTPVKGQEDYGRSGFMIHGDTVADVENGTKLASHGCIIAARAVREQIRDSGDTDLEVVQQYTVTSEIA